MDNLNLKNNNRLNWLSSNGFTVYDRGHYRHITENMSVSEQNINELNDNDWDMLVYSITNFLSKDTDEI